jgi:hypothetical protein
MLTLRYYLALKAEALHLAGRTPEPVPRLEFYLELEGLLQAWGMPLPRVIDVPALALKGLSPYTFCAVHSRMRKCSSSF